MRREPASKRQQRAVARIRARGRRAFVWRRGVLGSGLPWACAMAAFAHFSFSPELHAPLAPRALPRFLGWLLLFLPFGLGAGYLWARLTWWQFERKAWYLPRAAEQPPTPDP